MILSRKHKRILSALANHGAMSRDQVMSHVGAFISSRTMKQLEASGFAARPDGADAVKGGTRWAVTETGRQTVTALEGATP